MDRSRELSAKRVLLTSAIVATPALAALHLAGEVSVPACTLVLVAALSLAPLQRLMERLVDRTFSRRQGDFQATVHTLSEMLTTLRDIDTIGHRVTEAVNEAMRLEHAMLCLEQRRSRPNVWQRRAFGGTQSWSAPHLLDGPVAQALLAVAQPRGFAPVQELSPGSPLHAFFAEVGGRLLFPLLFRGKLVGWLLLGAKTSGHAFRMADIDLVRTLCNQVAIAVQNARSYEELEELNAQLDAKVQQQTAELRASHVAISRAYAELKTTQAQLVQSEKMASLGRLVAGVAHELNNPASFIHGALANIVDYVPRFAEVITVYEQLLRDAPELDAVAAEARARNRLDYIMRETPALLRICAEGSERITRIVADLRAFARADPGERSPTRIAESIDNSLNLLGHRLAGKSIRVECHYADVPPVEANPAQLNRVWMNLLSNAIDAIDGKLNGSIEVRVRPTNGAGSGVTVEIEDSGSGIPPDQVGRIFEPFFTTKPVGHGTGLGLSIVYGALKAHGGSIEVDSEPGKGTCFTIQLPAG